MLHPKALQINQGRILKSVQNPQEGRKRDRGMGTRGNKQKTFLKGSLHIYNINKHPTYKWSTYTNEKTEFGRVDLKKKNRAQLQILYKRLTLNSVT